MKFNLIIFLSFFILSKNIAQTFTPIEFENYTPLWTRISTTNKLPLNVQGYEIEQGYGNAPLVIHKNKLYNVYNIVNQYYDGYYLEAINLTDGKLLWEDSYIGFQRNTRKVGLLPCIKDNIIELPIFAEYELPDFPLFPIWIHAKAEKNSYDLSSGIKIDSTSNIITDPKAKELATYYSFIQNKFRSRLYTEGNNYRYLINKSLFNSITQEGLIQYESIVLAPNGLILDSLGFDITTKYPVSLNHLINLEDQSLFSFSISESGQDSTYLNQAYYHIFTRDLKILEQGDLSDKLPQSSGYSYTISYTDLFAFNILTYQQFLNGDNTLNYLSSFDRKGNLLETIDLRPLVLVNNQTTSNVLQSTIIYEDNVAKILFCVSKLENGKNQFTFYKTDGMGGYKQVKYFVAKKDLKKNIVIRKMYNIGENVLCLFNYLENETQTNPTPVWPSWVMFSGKDFEIRTDVNDITFDHFDIYPNPLSNQLEIHNTHNTEGKMVIFDAFGKNVLSLNKIENEINVQYLAAGIYFVHIILQNGVILTKKFLKE
jgi:hypothetical protein